MTDSNGNGESGLLEAALAYASAGIPVLPLHSPRDGGCSCGKASCESPAKHPRTANGLKGATADVLRVADWWRRWPDANIGIPTGERSGYVVLDIDPLHGGNQSIKQLERRHGRLKTARVLTGSGGAHFWFVRGETEIRNSAGKLGDGLDVRGDGGYVVAPPSVHASGKPYKWMHPWAKVPPAELPAWLTTENGNRAPAPAVDEHVPAGQRNATLASLAGSMRRRGMTETAIEAALKVENAARCDPPLSDNEVAAIARSIGRYEPEVSATVETETDEPREFMFVTLDEFLAHPFPEAEPLLGKPGEILLARGSLLMVYGPDGAGKSTWTIDGLAHLAAGVPWLGIDVPRPARIVIVENEGPAALFQKKLEAKIASWDGPEFGHNLYVYRAPWGEFTFANPEARAKLAAFCDEHDIDLVAANPTLGLGVASSGRPDETQQFVDWLVECGLKDRRAFWLLHHENKAGQISGDWGRHPDTKVSLRQDGDRQATKLDWAKTRWATLPTDTIPKTCILEWVTEGQGYNVITIEAGAVPDAELEGRIAEWLAVNPGATTRGVQAGVTGNKERIRSLLDGPRFDCVKGPRGALLWVLAGDSHIDCPPDCPPEVEG